MKIVIKKIIKEKNTIKYLYEYSGNEKCFDTNIIPYCTYDTNIESVPDSIAIIPFLSNILPIIFIFDGIVEVDEIDSVFVKAIDKYRKAYKKIIPQMEFKGKVIYKKIVKNNYKTRTSCVLFSGGVDGLHALLMNYNKISDCVMVHNINWIEERWNNFLLSAKGSAEKLGKQFKIVTTNFRTYLNYAVLEQTLEKIGECWWVAIQHGIATLGHIAPLAYINGYKTIYIGSSNTIYYKTICASDPLTDPCFKFGKTKTVHYGFNYDRCEKILSISKKLEDKYSDLNVQVCWESTDGKNCGHCEKCTRTYLNCRVMNVDYKKLGINMTLSPEELEKFVRGFNFNTNFARSEYGPIVKHFKKTLKHSPQLSDLKWLTTLPLPNDRFYAAKYYIKKIFPADTIRGKIIRKIYHKIKN